jgi:phage gp29-like protein
MNSKIVDKHGKPFNLGQLKKAQTSEIASLHKTFSEHPARGLTIEKIPRIMIAAEQGDISAQAALYDDMKERDGHIFAEMQKRENALVTLDRNINPPKSPNTREKELTKRVREWFDCFDVESIILNGAKAIGYGFSAQELAWERSDGLRLPVRFDLRPASWFLIDQQTNQLALNTGNQNGDALWDYGWLLHTYTAKSGFIGTAGLVRVLVYPYLFKNFSLRDLAEFLEIYGLPARIGTFLQGASQEEKDTLLDALVNLGHDAAGIIPQGSDIKFEAAASGSADNFKVMIDWCERTQSKIILGSTLTAQADSTSNTNALGNVHNEVRHDLKVADARQLERMFNRLIRMLCDLNGYADVPTHRLPKFSFDVREAADLKPFAEAVQIIVNAGHDQIPVSWISKKMGIPEPQGDEPVLQRAEPAMTMLSSQAPSPYKSFVALSQNAAESDPEQDALDNARALSESINDAMMKLIAPVVEALEQGESIDDALDLVAASYPALDDAQLQQILTQSITIANVWGRVNADK